METGHKLLEWLNTAKSSKSRSQRLERWSLELRAFQFSVVHRPGSTKQPADAFSRKPVTVVSISNTLEMTQLAQAQKSDSVLAEVISQLESQQPPKRAHQWLKFPHRRYLQLWSQLFLQNSVLYCKVKSPVMQQYKLLIVVPTALRKQFLPIAYDKAGHQGVDRMMAQR